MSQVLSSIKGSEVPRFVVDVDETLKTHPAVLSVENEEIDNDCAISMTDLVSVNSNSKKAKIRRGKNERSPPREKPLSKQTSKMELDDVVVTPVKAQFLQSTKSKAAY